MRLFAFKALFKLLIFTLLLGSCGSPGLNEGKASIMGTWDVYEVYYAEGTKTDLGIHTDTSYMQTGDLGRFIFDEDQVEYNYNYGLETAADQSSWDLLRSTVNCGFTTCEVYTLALEDLNLTCIFGDDTADAEENATQISLSFETEEIGPLYQYTLSLRK